MQTIWIIFLLLWSGVSLAQTRLNLAQALERATDQHPALVLQRLQLQQTAALEDQGRGHPAASLGYSVEELGAAGTGLHALGIQQSFNLPAVGNRQAAWQRALLATQRSSLAVQQAQVQQAVAQGYQAIVYYKHQIQLNQQILAVYDTLVLVAQRRAQVGETGALPLVAAQSAQQQLIVQQLRTQQQLQQALMDWRILLNDNTISDVADSTLAAPMPFLDSSALAHPLIAQLQAQQQASIAQRGVLEAQLLPQINTGVQLQLVEGTFPNVGAQIGFNVPLFNKGVRAQLQANQYAQQQLERAQELQAQQVTLQQQTLRQQMDLSGQQLQYYEQQLLPTLERQVQYSRRAYAVGEVNYLPVLETLQQYLTAQQSYLDLLWNYQNQRVTYAYWMAWGQK